MLKPATLKPAPDMKTSIIPEDTDFSTAHRDGWLTAMIRNVTLKKLNNIQFGRITLVENDRRYEFGGNTAQQNLDAVISIHDSRAYRYFALGGSVGAAEAYIHGFWSCDDLTSLIRIMVLNRSTLLDLETGLARLSKPVRAVWHRLNKNSRGGSKKNIQAHYDIGNDLFSLFLDESMMYSSAIYPRENSTLEEAAVYKIDLICRKLNLGSNDHLLEIGTGWGALAIHAARHYGCRVTSTTISEEQYTAAVDRVRQAGLEAQVDIIKRDYRDLDGRYDKLVSVEMLEAVGHQYFDSFFNKCCQLLKQDGVMLLQTITIADQYYERARQSVDFIQRFIFPGGCLPSISALNSCIARVTDFRLLHLMDYSDHYARTLREWRQRFFSNLQKVREMGYPESFVRLWEYYLCYCEGGFTEKSIGVAQLLLGRPQNRLKLHALQP